MEMENSENGFEFSALGEQFEPDEMGRMVRLSKDREELKNNDIGVLASAAQALHGRREQREALSDRGWQSVLARRRAASKAKKDQDE